MELLVLLVTQESRGDLADLEILDTRERLVAKEGQAYVVPKVFVDHRVFRKLQQWSKK